MPATIRLFLSLTIFSLSNDFVRYLRVICVTALTRPTFVTLLLMMILPAQAAHADDLATGALDFSPPASDLSVIMLGNMFGVVDGVLAGTGSQIAGVMFGVLNAAVLTLGGIVVTYTVMVSTLNSASDGQFMGNRWSSAWIPFRTVLGAALIIPKSSGYCVMQIFIMWVVVQGVGAADKVWNKTLSYLNSGGVIVSRTSGSETSASSSSNSDIFNGAYGILTGQVCMYALENVLKDYQTTLANSKSTNVCNNQSGVSGASSAFLSSFCSGTVPDFVESVDLSSDTVLSATGTVDVPMPNFSDTGDSNYSVFDGACGLIEFTQFSSTLSSDDMDSLGLSSSEQTTVSESRAVAMAQLYDSLKGTASSIVNNAPTFNADLSCPSSTSCVDSDFAQYNLGTPLTVALGYCTPTSSLYSDGQLKSTDCLSWDFPKGGTSSVTTVILDGTEIQDAVSAYNGMMSSALALKQQSGNISTYNKERAIVSSAESSGWLLAGGYYFRLAILTSEILDDANTSTEEDTQSGLLVCSPSLTSKTCGSSGTGSSSGGWDTADLEAVFTDCSGFSSTDSAYYKLFCAKTCQGSVTSTSCTAGNTAAIDSLLPEIKNISKLINGSYSDSSNKSSTQIPQLQAANDLENETYFNEPVYSGQTLNKHYFEPNSVYGYIINATVLGNPDDSSDESVPSITFPGKYSSKVDISKFSSISKSGGFFSIPGKVIEWMFNKAMKPVLNIVIELFTSTLDKLFDAVITPIMDLLASAVSQALNVMENPDTNPILGLANFGVSLIGKLGDTFVYMLIMMVRYSIAPPALMLLAALLPLAMVWLGSLFSIGFTCAFVIPFVPLMMFTFASIAWFVAVIESMIAAPIVALGLMHPEGNDVFGKADQAVLLSVNVFLRPTMMIIGYIFGIILSYVGIWFANEGFSIVIPTVEKMPYMNSSGIKFSDGSTTSAYSTWSLLFVYFFILQIYALMLIAIVRKAFEMVYYIPDKVLRWVSGGAAETFGEQFAQSLEGSMRDQERKMARSFSDNMATTQDSLMGLGVSAMQGGGDMSAQTPPGDESRTEENPRRRRRGDDELPDENGDPGDTPPGPGRRLPGRTVDSTPLPGDGDPPDDGGQPPPA